MNEHCPTCGHKLRAPHVRRPRCAVCGFPMEQLGYGRTRLVCGHECYLAWRRKTRFSVKCRPVPEWEAE